MNRPGQRRGRAKGSFAPESLHQIELRRRRDMAGEQSLVAGFSGYSDMAVKKDGTILCCYEPVAPTARTPRVISRSPVDLEWS